MSFYLFENIIMFQSFFSYIFPEQCIECQKEGAVLCKNCLKKISFTPHVSHLYLPQVYLDKLEVLCSYRDSATIKKMIYSLKYFSASHVSEILGDMMQKNFILSDDICITYIPMTWSRLFERGFNQSYLLAQAFSQKKPQVLLQKIKGGTRQALLKKKERLINIENSFIFCGSAVPDKVCIIDDVASTGSTLNECARILKEAGVKYVSAIVLARNE
ncbi:hypothetical protein COB57_05790 [Candidatus Peregrinibacteria bacterium]|nr:MAG: hypothetical protein COB57_05790 [Candidatus Peregrinibacteria bacterium]